MPKDEMSNHNCIKHLRSVVQQQATKISDLEKNVAEHKHQLGEQVRMCRLSEYLISLYLFIIKKHSQITSRIMQLN